MINDVPIHITKIIYGFLHLHDKITTAIYFKNFETLLKNEHGLFKYIFHKIKLKEWENQKKHNVSNQISYILMEKVCLNDQYMKPFDFVTNLKSFNKYEYALEKMKNKIQKLKSKNNRCRKFYTHLDNNYYSELYNDELYGESKEYSDDKFYDSDDDINVGQEGTNKLEERYINHVGIECEVPTPHKYHKVTTNYYWFSIVVSF